MPAEVHKKEYEGIKVSDEYLPKNTTKQQRTEIDYHPITEVNMELAAFYKSVLDQDLAPIVLCDLGHTIVYMNPAAITRYAKSGGAELIGKSLMACHNKESEDVICKVIDWFRASKENNIIYESRNDAENKEVYMVALRDDNGELIGYYEKHEYRNRETCKQYDMINIRN